jgi:hypothetical protein
MMNIPQALRVAAGECGLYVSCSGHLFFWFFKDKSKNLSAPWRICNLSAPWRIANPQLVRPLADLQSFRWWQWAV